MKKFYVSSKWFSILVFGFVFVITQNACLDPVGQVQVSKEASDDESSIEIEFYGVD